MKMLKTDVLKGSGQGGLLTQPSDLQNGLCNNTGHMFGHLIGHLMNVLLNDLSGQLDGPLEAPKSNDLEKHISNTPDY